MTQLKSNPFSVTEYGTALAEKMYYYLSHGLWAHTSKELTDDQARKVYRIQLEWIEQARICNRRDREQKGE